MTSSAGMPTHDLDQPALTRWLAATVEGFAPPVRIAKFPDGQSNPTYRLEAASGTYVLRRKPFGPLLPSAHAVDREYRLLRALQPRGVPVAGAIALCTDESVIGAIFYVMEFVDGRVFWDGTLPGLAAAERRAVYEEAIRTLARLHSLDHVAVGLNEFGRPGNYFARQVKRWTQQYRAAQTAQIEPVEKLIEWLPRTVPEQTRIAIIHGDYRIDNLIFAANGTRLRAVLDWELSTIGDPLADFAYFAMNWSMPADGRSGLQGADLAGSGIPSLDEAVALYCACTERDDVPDLHWYFAYNLFRLVGIVQGIRKRIIDGNASSAAAEASAARLVPLAEAAWREARMAGAAG